MKTLEEIKQEYAPVAQLWVHERQNDVYVSSIVVNKDMRNQGIGNNIMKDIIRYANSVNKPVSLTPSADLGGKLGKLKEFYKELGFKPNKGRGADYSISAGMIRNPTLESIFKPFLKDICTDVALYESILKGFNLCFEGISVFDISQMQVPMYTKPIGEEPNASYANIFKTVSPSVGASGEVSEPGRSDYKYGPALASPTRDIREETKDNFDKVKIPKLTVAKEQSVVNLIKKAQPHLPKGGLVGKDFAREYNNYANSLLDKTIVYDTKLL